MDILIYETKDTIWYIEPSKFHRVEDVVRYLPAHATKLRSQHVQHLAWEELVKLLKHSLDRNKETILY